MLSLILAVSENNVIGKDKKIPWHLSEDLKRFKKITLGKKIIMGKKTFESLPKLLPGREHIVITRNKKFKKENVRTVNSLKDLYCYTECKDEVMVIGGGEIYKLLLPYANKIYLTLIKKQFKGDTFFEFDKSNWKITKIENCQNENFEYSYINYEKIKSYN